MAGLSPFTRMISITMVGGILTLGAPVAATMLATPFLDDVEFESPADPPNPVIVKDKDGKTQSIDLFGDGDINLRIDEGRYVFTTADGKTYECDALPRMGAFSFNYKGEKITITKGGRSTFEIERGSDRSVVDLRSFLADQDSVLVMEGGPYSGKIKLYSSDGESIDGRKVIELKGLKRLEDLKDLEALEGLEGLKSLEGLEAFGSALDGNDFKLNIDIVGDDGDALIIDVELAEERFDAMIDGIDDAIDDLEEEIDETDSKAERQAMTQALKALKRNKKRLEREQKDMERRAERRVEAMERRREQAEREVEIQQERAEERAERFSRMQERELERRKRLELKGVDGSLVIDLNGVVEKEIRSALEDVRERGIELRFLSRELKDELSDARSEIEEALRGLEVEVRSEEGKGLRIRLREEAEEALGELEEKHLEAIKRAEEELKRARERLEKRLAEKKAQAEKTEDKKPSN